MINRIFFLPVLSILYSAQLYAEFVSFESGDQQGTLIELYTSEGCSSCPPAEEYLNSYVNKQGLWREWFPAAFHVDYWDYIGWRDRFADKRFGLRQSAYARLKRSSTVYTPAFMVNGHSWRPGIFNRTLKPSTRSAGNLRVKIDLESKSLEAGYVSEKASANKLVLHVALLGMNLETDILRGENEGRQARHEFVVVGYGSRQSSDKQWRMPLPTLHYQGAKKYSVVTWISTLDNPTPLQVTGRYLPGYK